MALMSAAGNGKKKDWVYFAGLDTGAKYLLNWNSMWLSSANRNGLTFNRKGKVRVNIYVKTEGEWYHVYVSFNGQYLVKTDDHDGDKSYSGVLNVTPGSSISIYIGGGYNQKVYISIYEE